MSVVESLFRPRHGAEHFGAWFPPGYKETGLVERLDEFEIRAIKGAASRVYLGIGS